MKESFKTDSPGLSKREAFAKVGEGMSRTK